MKKKMCLGLCAVLLSSMLFGACGGQQPAPQTEETSDAAPEEEAAPEETSAEEEAVAETAEAADTDAEEAEAVAPGDEVVVYLVRHGKTFFNTTGQVQGFADSPLTDVGVEQAIKVGQGMKDMVFATAFSSDLGRQRATANYILAENANPVPELTELYGLREWNYGGFEGKTNAEMWTPIFEQYGLTFDEDWTDYEELVSILGDEGIADAIAASDPLGEAETYDEIIARSQEAMDRIVGDTLAAGGGNALVVSSGGEIPTILTMLVPEQYQGQDIGNCSVTILTYKDGQYTLGIVGDKSYLEG